MIHATTHPRRAITKVSALSWYKTHETIYSLLGTEGGQGDIPRLSAAL